MRTSISVIIPFYNSINFFEDCLLSISKQYYDNALIEVIIIDDHSSSPIDQKVLTKFKNLGLSINLIRLQTNSGPGIARLTGLLNSKNEFIAFLDADDEWLDHKLFTQISVLNKFKSDCVASKIIDHDLINNIKYIRGNFKNSKTFLYDILMGFVSIPMSTILINRKILLDEIQKNNNLKTFNLDHFELLLLVSKLKFRFIEEPLAIYKLHNDNISKKRKYNFHYSKVLFHFFISEKNNLEFKYLFFSLKYFVKGVIDILK